MAIQGTGSWTRGMPSNGLRQINLRYDVSDAEYAAIEEVLEKMPYKQVNKGMLQVMLLGARIYLQTANAGSPIVAPLAGKNTRSADKPAAAPAYSGTAQGMFEQFGGEKK